MRIAENVESAADHELEGAELMAAIDQARIRLADYDAVSGILAVDSKVLQKQFAAHFEDDIGLIRESLARIDSVRGTGQ